MKLSIRDLFMETPLRIALVCIVASQLAFSHQSAAVVGRHDADDARLLGNTAEYPALFALYTTKAGHPDCIATLVTVSWAITAAHCTEDAALIENLGKGGHVVQTAWGQASIDRVVRNPNSVSGRPVDIALLHLASPAVRVKPIAIYEYADEAGRTVLIPGWGGTGDGIAGEKEELADGRFRIVENRVDAARDGWLIWSFDDPRSGTGRALAFEGISGAGDSGGPALILTPSGLAVAGVSSAQRTFGRGPGLYGNDEYFARVSDQAPWIHGVVRQADIKGQ